jgi:Collagen triple helix repeat (20 copies)
MISSIVKSIRQSIVAWLALFVALTGTSMAASHYIVTSTRQIKPSVLKHLHGQRGARGPAGKAGPQGESGSKGDIGERGLPGTTGERGEKGEQGGKGELGEKGVRGEAGERGEKGDRGEKGERGEQGEKGERGERGEAGGALAYAHVNEEGNTIEAVEQGTTVEAAKVERPEEGVYCISGLGFGPHNVVVTPDDKASEAPFFATATLNTSLRGLCGGTTQVTVEIWRMETTAHTRNAPFYIEIN